MAILSRDKTGCILTSNGRKPCDIDMARAIKLYQKPLSIKQVAILIESNFSVLQRRFQKLGICRDKGWFNRGHKASLKTRKRMSLTMKKLLSDPVQLQRLRMGENNPFYGKRHKPETIEAMKLKLSKLMSGEGNPQWQGGKSLEPYTSEFKRAINKQVYKRDNYQCQNCGIAHKPSGGRLVAHHKDAIKSHCDKDNLITLCRPCHGRITMGARWGKEVVKIL